MMDFWCQGIVMMDLDDGSLDGGSHHVGLMMMDRC